MIEVTYWVCPKCGLTIRDEPWHREKPDRTICQRDHEPTQMVLETRKYSGYFN